MRESSINKLLVVIVLMMGALSMRAQTTDEIKDRIIDIKLDDGYVYGEASDANQSIAYDDALMEMVNMLNQARMSEGKSKVAKNDVLTRVKELHYDRGELQLYFVYIPLAEGLSIVPSSERAQNGQPAYGGALTQGQATATAPTPSTTPAKTPAGNQGKTSSTAPSATATSVPAPATNPAPAPANSPSATPAATPVFSGDAEQRYLNIAQNVIERQMFVNVHQYLNSMLQRGQISSYEKARSREEIPDDAFVVVIDREYSVAGFMGPKTASGRINLKTQRADALTNYTDVVFLWYK